MKKTGRMIVCDGNPRPRFVSSTRHLFSKWVSPVWRWAEATDE